MLRIAGVGWVTPDKRKTVRIRERNRKNPTAARELLKILNINMSK